MTAPDARTNFAQYSHAQLYAMLYAGNPDTARNAAATWNDTGNGLHDQANQLTKKLSGFSQAWQGGAANQYQRMVRDLIGGIQKVADTAYRMRDLAYDAADAQDTARAQMPAPVDVPALPAATVALASAPIQIDAGTPASVVAQIQQARATAITAVQNQQQASAAADAAHAQAVQVMTALAGAYVTAKNSIPPSPDAEVAPNLPTGGAITDGTAVGTPLTPGATTGPIVTDVAWSRSGDLTDLPDTGNPTSGMTTGQPTQQDSPLFGDMFTAGVAAASAAVFGRFGSLVPKVPGFVNKNKNGGSAAAPTDGSTPKLGDKIAAADAAKLGGAGGGAALKGLGGGGIGGLGGVGGGSAPTPSASPSLMSPGNIGSDVAAGAAGAAGVAAKSATGMPMMPMMPMSGMAGGDMGGGRRIPPWLVETEDVWGESSAVSPTVIGEDPDLGGGQGWPR
ncbi:MAG TPA: WXG100 family type VII secretion target [Pseudonocardiaceae bacterium]|jgi:hypothetical protein|nr:WXG100 family type VII secretion target [Pseudonocardiaceae bacterium]